MAAATVKQSRRMDRQRTNRGSESCDAFPDSACPLSSPTSTIQLSGTSYLPTACSSRSIDMIWRDAESAEPLGYHVECGDFHDVPAGTTIADLLNGQTANPKVYVGFDPRPV